MTFDDEAHAIVDHYDRKVNEADSREAALNHAWMIELAAREISHAHGATATETVHWMRVRFGQIDHFINHKWGSGSSPYSPNPDGGCSKCGCTGLKPMDHDPVGRVICSCGHDEFAH